MTVDELDFFQTLGYRLTKTSYFFKDSMSLEVDHLKGLGIIFFISLCALCLGQLLCSSICYAKYVSDESNYSNYLKLLVFVLFSVIIDICLSICIAIIALQLGLGGFIIIGLIYIFFRAITSISADREDASGFGITRSIATLIGAIHERNEILNNYTRMYNIELTRSTNLWKKIKQ